VSLELTFHPPYHQNPVKRVSQGPEGSSVYVSKIYQTHMGAGGGLMQSIWCMCLNLRRIGSVGRMNELMVLIDMIDMKISEFSDGVQAWIISYRTFGSFIIYIWQEYVPPL
jgi:hypothetical protein